MSFTKNLKIAAVALFTFAGAAQAATVTFSGTVYTVLDRNEPAGTYDFLAPIGGSQSKALALSICSLSEPACALQYAGLAGFTGPNSGFSMSNEITTGVGNRLYHLFDMTFAPTATTDPNALAEIEYSYFDGDPADFSRNDYLAYAGFFDGEIAPTAVVPLPASALLLMGALAGFGALRRRT